MRKIRNQELDQREGEKQVAQSLLQFHEKLVTFMKLCNIRILTLEEANTEQKLERIINNIVYI